MGDEEKPDWDGGKLMDWWGVEKNWNWRTWKNQTWMEKNLTGPNGMIVTTMMRMTWKKVMLHLPRKKKMILHLHLVKMKLKMKMIHLHLVKIVDEKESLENLENPVNPSLLQNDLKT